MPRRCTIRVSRVTLACVVLLPLLAGCGLGSSSEPSETITWNLVTSEPALLATAAPGTPVTDSQPRMLTPEECRTHRPNELASIPILEYHVITTDESKESDPFVRTAAHLRVDLQWLYDHGFYVITTRQLIENRISAPAGKRPVLLSFDDGTSTQFRWEADANKERTIDPDSAVGVLEAFFQEHPDFGRGGQFAVLPFNCFADDTPMNTIEDCPDKLRWLADNGYEIVNHTAGHQDLRDVTDEEFAFQVGDPVLWLDDIVPGDGNLMDVIVMPYGN